METSILNDQQKKDKEFLDSLSEEHRDEVRHTLTLLRAFQNKDKEAFGQEMNNYSSPLVEGDYFDDDNPSQDQRLSKPQLKQLLLRVLDGLHKELKRVKPC